MRVAGLKATQHRDPIARRFFGLWGMLLLSFTGQAADSDLIAYQGTVVYLDFWASWCGPCKQSFPWMQLMQDTYDRQGFKVVAVNLDRQRADAAKFIERFRPTFEVRFDPNGKLGQVYHVKAMPSSVLIDRHGMIRFTHEGFRPIDAAAYEAQVRELLAEK